MFGDDMRSDFMQDEYIWNNNGIGQDFWRGRIWENGMPQDVERNNAYLYEMYPKESKIIKGLVEEALDLEDYRGSFIYDEYPDKFLFLRMARKIADRYTNEHGVRQRMNGMENHADSGANGMENGDMEQMNHMNHVKPWVIEVVQVILVNEIFRRRNRRRYW